MAAPFDDINAVRKTYFINESERSVDPADDAGKLVQLEANGKISKEFLSLSTVIEFTDSDTYTPNAAAQFILIEAVGAGASGAAANASADGSAVATGGGGGEYRSTLIHRALVTAPISITIGAPGTARVTAGRQALNGIAGGDTIVGSFLTAKGGLPGVATLVTGTGNTGLQQGGVGGTLGSSQFLPIANENGGDGGDAQANGGGGGGNTVTPGGNSVKSGAGGGAAAGNSPFSLNSASVGGDASDDFGGDGGDGSNTVAQAGQSYGAGGGGAANRNGNVTSGAGFKGFVRLTEYF